MIREAREADVPAVVGLVHELAEYERSPELCTLTEDQLHAAVFGPEAVARCHVAEVAGEVVGCAIWFQNFSTWRGVPGIYLEDLFVRPAHRVRGRAPPRMVPPSQSGRPRWPATRSTGPRGRG